MLCIPLALSLALTAVPQGDVWVVDQDLGPGADFQELQAAVDAASPGDTILLRAGTYARTAIDAKGLTIAGAYFGDPQLDAPLVRGLTIENLAAGQDVVVHGLRPISADGAESLVVANCAGDVLLQELAVFAGAGTSRAAIVSSSAAVTFSSCTVSPFFAQALGLESTSSNVYTYDSSFFGGFGTTPPSCASSSTSGIPSVFFHGGLLFASGSAFQGGPGGLGLSCASPGDPGCDGSDGGAGIHLTSGAELVEIGSSFQGGAGGTAFVCQPGDDGEDIAVSSGTVTHLLGEPRSTTANAIVGVGDTVDLTFAGQPGDQVFLIYQTQQDPVFLPACAGVLVPAWVAPVAFVGSLPGAGLLDVSVPLNGVPPGLDALTLYAQAAFLDASVTCTFGTPRAFALLGCAATTGDPDCNGNGILDDCEILKGTSLDANENWVLDECE